ncbi:MAG: hypothetical protein PSN34_04300 [Urechidicola sp.]|nr:hypothetical protein [Urechidicola sp.]
MTKGKYDPLRLRIIEFKIVNGNIKAPYEFDDSLIDNYETSMAFGSSFNLEKKVVKANMGFEIETKSTSEQDEALVNFDFVYIFEVDNLDELFTEGAAPEDLKRLMTAIAAISFSTSRGILLTRLQGTVMKEYILPIVNPVKLLDEWINEGNKKKKQVNKVK